MDLVADRANPVEQLVSKAADKVLGRVHSHTGVSGLPINGPPDLIPNLKLMACFQGVVDRVTPSDFNDVNRAIRPEKFPRIPMLPTAKWKEECTVKSDVVSINFGHGCIKSAVVAVLEVLEVEFDPHASHDISGCQEVSSLSRDMSRDEILEEPGMFCVRTVDHDGRCFPSHGEGNGGIPQGSKEADFFVLPSAFFGVLFEDKGCLWEVEVREGGKEMVFDLVVKTDEEERADRPELDASSC